LKTLIEGIKMTEKSLQKTFLKHGVIKYGTIGEVFDPDLHDALFAAPDASKTSGTVSQVLNNGYKLKDRVLRPAQVGTIA
jgi:molecular chaperone GrpE